MRQGHLGPRRAAAALILGFLIAVPLVQAGDIPPPEQAAKEASPFGVPRSGDAIDGPPVWDVGQWWRYRVRDPFSGAAVEVVRVVARIDGPDYLVGVPRSDLSPTLLLTAHPSTGRIGRGDLSLLLGDSRFEPVRFPLFAGASWTTRYWRSELEARVVSVDGPLATIEYRDAGAAAPGVMAVYDARHGAVTSLRHGAVVEYELVDAGRGFACTVTVPLEPSLVTQTRVVDAIPARPATIRVDARFDALALVLGAAGRAAGTASAAAVAPDGTSYSVRRGPLDDPGGMTRSAIHLRPGGDWRFQHASVLGGMAWSLAIAYRLLDVHPRPDEGAPGASDPPSCIAADEARSAAGAIPGYPPPTEAPPPWAWGAAALGAATLAAVALGALWPRRGLVPPVLLALFSRIGPAEALDHPRRRSVYDLVRAEPGITTQEIRRALGLGWGTTVHHLGVLERAGLVASAPWGNNRDWFAAHDVPPADRPAVSALRRPQARNLYELIREAPGRNQQELARRLGVHHGTVLFHARRLARAGLIRTERRGPTTHYYPVRHDDPPS